MDPRTVKVTVAPGYDICVHVLYLPMTGDEQRMIVVDAHEVDGEYLDRDELIHLTDTYAHLIIAALIDEDEENGTTIH